MCSMQLPCSKIENSRLYLTFVALVNDRRHDRRQFDAGEPANLALAALIFCNELQINLLNTTRAVSLRIIVYRKEPSYIAISSALGFTMSKIMPVLVRAWHEPHLGGSTKVYELHLN